MRKEVNRGFINEQVTTLDNRGSVPLCRTHIELSQLRHKEAGAFSYQLLSLAG